MLDCLVLAKAIPTFACMAQHRIHTPALFALIALSGASLAPGAQASKIGTFRTSAGTVTATEVAGGLANPWGMAFLPNGALLVTERQGALRLLKDGKLSGPLKGVPDVVAAGQGGLLDVAIAKDFAESGTIFLSFSEAGRGGAGTAIARARLVQDGASAHLEDVRVIFSMERKTRAGQHFGSRIVVAPDGSLFFTIGDRGDGERAQDWNDEAGAVLHINPDGTPAKGNVPPSGGKPVLWSKGHRNPQGATWDPVSQSLWTIEHGARGGDELNNPKAGLNYGWPVISYGRHYSGLKIGQGTEAEGYEQPAFYWDPSIAPSGLAVYDGAMFPEWKGDFLAGALKFQLLTRIDRLEDGSLGKEERLFTDAFGRIRDVEVAPDGSIWLLTDEDPGQIIRIAR